MGISLPSLPKTRRQNSLKRGHQRSHCHEVFLLFDILVDSALLLKQIHDYFHSPRSFMSISLYIGLLHESLQKFKIIGNYEKNNCLTVTLQSSNAVGYLLYEQKQDTVSSTVIPQNVLFRPRKSCLVTILYVKEIFTAPTKLCLHIFGNQCTQPMDVYKEIATFRYSLQLKLTSHR